MSSRGTSKLRSRFFTVFFMFIVTFACISVVSAIHLTSRERVERNETLYKKKGIMLAAGLEVPADADRVLDWYDTCVTARPNAEEPVCFEVRASAEGPRTAVIFVRQGAGLWGTIEAVVGLDASLKSFTGIAFVRQNETPGLGARIMEPWYREHIKGKRGGLTLVSEKSGSEDPSTLDAITGATVTSKAVRDILNGLAEEAPDIMASVRTVSNGPGIQ